MGERYKKTTTLSLTSLLHLYPSLSFFLCVCTRGGVKDGRMVRIVAATGTCGHCIDGNRATSVDARANALTARRCGRRSDGWTLERTGDAPTLERTIHGSTLERTLDAQFSKCTSHARFWKGTLDAQLWNARFERRTSARRSSGNRSGTCRDVESFGRRRMVPSRAALPSTPVGTVKVGIWQSYSAEFFAPGRFRGALAKGA
jgi:hypothetical protein